MNGSSELLTTCPTFTIQVNTKIVTYVHNKQFEPFIYSMQCNMSGEQDKSIEEGLCELVLSIINFKLHMLHNGETCISYSFKK